MTLETKNQLNPQPIVEEWTPPLPPTDLIFDDGEPMETYRHRLAMNLLIDSLDQAYRDREDYFVGGNMFIYYSSTQARNRDFRGPDFFAVLNVQQKSTRQGWVVWEEEGRYPDVIVELTSPSTAAEDLGRKKEIYEQIFKTPDYFIYNPFNPNSLRGWRLGKHFKYEELSPNEQGWLWSESLGLWLGTWPGLLKQDQAYWLRFYTIDGQLVPLPEEFERLRAEQERLRAEQERLRAEQERLRAEQEREKSARLAAKLRELGLDPETI